MLILHAAEQREFVIRPHVQLEGSKTREPGVVHTFGVLAVAFSTGLPVPFEHRPRSIVERGKLRKSNYRESQAHCRRESGHQLPPAAPSRHRVSSAVAALQGDGRTS